MKNYYADLHIHVGMSERGKWVKIPTSRQLTVRNILDEAVNRKGMQIIGIVDALSPWVLEDLQMLEDTGELILLPGGGYTYHAQVTLLLGAEIETREPHGGMCHTLLFLPDLATMKRFSAFMAQFIKNVNLSSQNAHMPLGKLVEIANSFEASIIPAHIFTPHKSLYGSCAARMTELLTDKQLGIISAIELGLSADTDMADRIQELNDFTFVTNSDAHSLAKIAREYNIFSLGEPSFAECKLAWARAQNRKVQANYGLDPKLGKYHRTFCIGCNYISDSKSFAICPVCGSSKIVKGVFDRIAEIADLATSQHPKHRPPYYYQIPLEFIPGLGRKTIDKLLTAFGSEMNVLHQVSEQELSKVIGPKMASLIVAARSGMAKIQSGGGGKYGACDF